jgi:hypothetical protein
MAIADRVIVWISANPVLREYYDSRISDVDQRWIGWHSRQFQNPRTSMTQWPDRTQRGRDLGKNVLFPRTPWSSDLYPLQLQVNFELVDCKSESGPCPWIGSVTSIWLTIYSQSYCYSNAHLLLLLRVACVSSSSEVGFTKGQSDDECLRENREYVVSFDERFQFRWHVCDPNWTSWMHSISQSRTWCHPTWGV